MSSELLDMSHEDLTLYSSLPVCGCGRPEQVYALYRAVLQVTPTSHANRPKGEDWPTWEEKMVAVDGGERLFYVLAYVLDHIEATEHGGGVAMAWRTEEGDRLLALLDRHAESNYEAMPCVLTEIEHPASHPLGSVEP